MNRSALSAALLLLALAGCKEKPAPAARPEPRPAMSQATGDTSRIVALDPEGIGAIELPQAQWDSLRQLLLLMPSSIDADPAPETVPDPVFFSAETFNDAADIYQSFQAEYGCREEIALRMSALMVGGSDSSVILKGSLDDSVLQDGFGCGEFAWGRKVYGFYPDSAAGKGTWKPVAMRYSIRVDRAQYSTFEKFIPVRLRPYVGDPDRDPQPLLFASSTIPPPAKPVPFAFLSLPEIPEGKWDTTQGPIVREAALGGRVPPGFPAYRLRRTFTWQESREIDEEGGYPEEDYKGHWNGSNALIAGGRDGDTTLLGGEEAGTDLSGMAVGDLDGDGKPDYWFIHADLSEFLELSGPRTKSIRLRPRGMEPEGC